MKTLMLRQVRLLAAPALVSMGLGLVPLVGLSLSTELRLPSMSPAELALMLVAIVAPWLIAVAAIAPDAESGGLAFLGGLPLGRARHFALRALVALGWSIVAIAPFLVLAAREFPRHQLADDLARALLPGALAFVAGLAAGAVTRQSLGAFITAPLLLVVPIGLYEAFAYAMRAPAEFLVAGPVVACALLLVAGWLGFRDPAVGASWRPLLRTSGLLLGAVVLGCGVTTAAWAHAVAFPASYGVSWSIQGPLLVRIERRVPDWPSAPYHDEDEWSTTLYPAAGLEQVEALDDLEAGWTFDEVLHVIATTPEGHVLAHASDASQASRRSRLMLLDPTTRKVIAFEPDDGQLAWPYSTSPADDHTTEQQPSVDGEAWFVTRDAVKTFGGRLLRTLPAGFQLLATGGTRLVGLLHGERLLFDVATGAQRSLGDVSDQDHVYLSPRGRYLLRWKFGSRERALTLLDLDEDRQASLPLPQSDGPPLAMRFSLSPNDRSALVTWTATRAGSDDSDDTVAEHTVHNVAVDLASGTVTRLEGLQFAWGTSVRWSPSGRRLVGDGGGWLDLDVAPLVIRELQQNGSVLGFVDEDAVLWRTWGPTGGELRRIALTELRRR